MTEIRTAIPEEIDKFLDSLVRTGPFSSKAELVRAALLSFAGSAGPMAREFDKENLMSPDGRVYQLEYAREASRRGGPGVGMVYEGGILLAVDNPQESKLAKPAPKIYRMEDRLALLASGLTSDAYLLAHRAKESNATTTEEVIDSLVQMYWQHTIDRRKRPLGAALLLGSVLEGQPRLYYVDPSGAFLAYEAVAIGQDDERRMEFLEERYTLGSASEAERIALEALDEPSSYELLHLSV